MRSLLIVVALAAAPALAQMGVTPLAAYDFEHGSPAVGLAFEARFPRGPLPVDLSIRPSAMYVFRDAQSEAARLDVRVFRADFDVLGRFETPGAPFAPYAKAGVEVDVVNGEMYNLSGLGTGTDVSVRPTLGGGLGFGRVGAEITVGVGENPTSRLGIGYRF